MKFSTGPVLAAVAESDDDRRPLNRTKARIQDDGFSFPPPKRNIPRYEVIILALVAKENKRPDKKGFIQTGSA